DGDEVIRGWQRAGLQHRLEILDQEFGGDRLTHLFGQAGAALVVAQRAELRAQGRKDSVPAGERAAHLVQEHDRWSLAGKLEMDADAVDVHPGHGFLLPTWRGA